MGTKIKQNKNSTTFVRCPKDKQHTFTRVPSNIIALGGYKEAIMTQIISNQDGWNLVKSEIFNRLDFPERKFLNAWKELESLGYIKIERKWGSYNYTIYEDPTYTTCTDGDCIYQTTGSSTSCTGATLTTINNNYDNTEESYGKSVNEPVMEVTTMMSDEQNSDLHNHFIELYDMYPKEVIRPDGFKAYLKSDRKRCEELYIEYLNEGLLTHSKVLDCLKTELQVRNQNGTMKYIKRFVKWLSEREFNAYKDKADKPVYIPYGTEFI